MGEGIQPPLAAPCTPQVSLRHYLTCGSPSLTLYLIASIVCSVQGNLGSEHVLTNGQSFIGSRAPSLLRQIRCSRFLGSRLGSCSRGNRSPGSALSAAGYQAR